MMVTLPRTLFAAALFCGTGLALSAEGTMTTADIQPTDEGVLFVNSLGVPIIDAFAQPEEQCDVYLCDKWQDLDPKGWVLSQGRASAMGMIFSSSEGKPRICQWSLKIVVEDAHSYEFGPLDVCVPELRMRIDFIQGEDGSVTAVQHWKDEKGVVQSARFPAH